MKPIQERPLLQLFYHNHLSSLFCIVTKRWMLVVQKHTENFGYLILHYFLNEKKTYYLPSENSFCLFSHILICLFEPCNLAHLTNMMFLVKKLLIVRKKKQITRYIILLCARKNRLIINSLKMRMKRFLSHLRAYSHYWTTTASTITKATTRKAVI